MSRTSFIHRCARAWGLTAPGQPGRVALALALTGLLAFAVGLRATSAGQDPVPPPAGQGGAAAGPPGAAGADATKRPASAGVYTAQQAERGAQSFGNICEGCHSLSSFTNDKFRKAWLNQPLADLFGLIVDTMPDDDPGGLPIGEYADVIAYLLKSNGFAAGQQELPTTTEGLKGIVLDFASGTHSGE